ncbi:MAG: OmpA family protein [Sedimentisphaerales bacterium]|nr:OmpA family protein [Sedimentisphaerales bacterium]MBN2841927.1 OmpA family protein [Sedimentisphaerales bacterium]
MKATKLVLTLVFVSTIILTTGCTDWQKKYNNCNAELENLQALLDRTSQALSDCEDSSAELSRQLSAVNQPAKPEAKSELETMGTYDSAKGTITVTLESNVLFNSGRVDLRSEAKSRLQRIASIINRDYPGKEVWVIGHTDTDPIKKSKWQDNWELSAERALSVTRHLVSSGVSARNLVAAGRGEFHPAGSKADSRRVEIVVYTR